MKEDSKVRPGVWWFSWPWKTPYDDGAVEVHDRNTGKDSFAAKIGIPGSRVDENFGEMVDETIKVKKLNRGWRILGGAFKGVVTMFGRWFTEGKYFK